MAIAYRTLWFAILLVVAARVLNRRTLMSGKPFDFVVNVAYGTLAGTAILSPAVPMWSGTIAIIVLTAFAWLMNILAASPAGARLLVGSAMPLVEQGKVRTDSLRRLHMTEASLREQLREYKVASVADVELAVLNTDGKLGVVMRAANAEDHHRHVPAPVGPEAPRPPEPEDRPPL